MMLWNVIYNMQLHNLKNSLGKDDVSFAYKGNFDDIILFLSYCKNRLSGLVNSICKE